MNSWSSFDRRSPQVIAKLLRLLEDKKAQGTFFVLGWLAEREPEMIRDIARAGHEIASHSWDHRRVDRQSPPEFRESVRRSKGILEDIAGAEIIGFRAPSWSIVPGVEWAFDVLLEEGYGYDSSLFPMAFHPTYGYPGASRDPYWVERSGGALAEIPPATLRRLGSNFPASGGAYLRFFPYALLETALRDSERREQPGTIYIHPWEMDEYVPDLPMSAVARLRTFGGSQKVWPRVTRLMNQFRFRPIGETVQEMNASRSATRAGKVVHRDRRA
jgi:polysaccharide deacetylase family protein (PEP-CTERM system associated)